MLNFKGLSNEEANKLTKESIQIALISLMEDKSINDISITEIVKRAGVSRTAFYRNYKSKEDIILEVFNSIIIYLKEASLVEKYGDNHFQFFYDVLTKVKANPVPFKTLLEVNLSSKAKKSLEEFIYSLLPNNSIEEQYILLGSIEGLKIILLKWISNGFNESIETIANICNDFINF